MKEVSAVRPDARSSSRAIFGKLSVRDGIITVSIEMYASIEYKDVVKCVAHSVKYRNVHFICGCPRTKPKMLFGENRMTIEEVLVKQYGALLSLDQLATILDRSPEGLRISLRSSGEWVRRINAARLRLGRRVYFRTSEIANVLDAR